MPFTSFEEAEKNIRGEPPDIAFIRIGKSEINAFKLTSEFRLLNPFSKVIFISSQEEYAVDAFKFEADGFLLVPFSEEKIKDLVLRIIKKRRVYKIDEVNIEYAI